GFSLYETAIGPCGIAWGAHGVIGAQLPEGGLRATRARLARRFPEAREWPPPPAQQAAIASITALIGGERRDLRDIELDMRAVSAFERRVYEAARAIMPGATATYGEIANAIGAPEAARAVGAALGRNPFSIIVPCHRVLAAHGKTGGFTARGGISAKFRVLAIERAGAEGTLFEDLDFSVRPPRKS
ncbi:MAG: methylated-DNA--[protein]-cysteine S-methyltransferase, partial [Hyphomonadaceae bacterium]